MTGVLKVDTIQSTTGNAAITIDSAGRILQPNKPMFKVHRSANVQFTSANNNTKLTGWDTDTGAGAVNIGGMWSTANDRATVPVTGMYAVEFKGYFHTGTYGQLGIGIYVNGGTSKGSDWRRNRDDFGTYNGYDSVSWVTHLYLNANDYFEFYYIQHGGTQQFHPSSGDYYSGVVGYLIG